MYPLKFNGGEVLNMLHRVVVAVVVVAQQLLLFSYLMANI
jgi:hypothetical protein